MTESAARSTDNVIYADFGTQPVAGQDPELTPPIDWSEVTGETRDVEAALDATVLHLRPSKKRAD